MSSTITTQLAVHGPVLDAEAAGLFDRGLEAQVAKDTEQEDPVVISELVTILHAGAPT